jgi:RNA polymerase sigma-70 factor (ECF subfamily)
MEDGDGVGPRFLERLLQREQKAWAEFFETHRDRIYSLCLRMLHNREEAEDISQEVFERAVKSIASFRGEASLKTWLYQIAHNACLTHIAAAKKSGQSMSDGRWMTALASAAPSPEQSSASGEIRAALESAVGDLEAIFREAILLREVEDQSYGEIARVTGVSVNTVKTRIHRAREQLRRRLVEFR